jgi:hypothetical protein
MSRNNSEFARLLSDTDFFQTAVNFTSRRTAFAARLIEWDYSDFNLERAVEAVVIMAGKVQAGPFKSE